MNYYFEWDKNKEKANRLSHKISFERASTIFHDPKTLTIFDDEHSIEEDRWLTLGIDNTGILLIVSHTFVEETTDICRIRIISARKAEKNEEAQYRG